MRIMLSIILLSISSLCFAQKDIYDESLDQINKVNDMLVDCMASFLEFPSVHSNTIKIYDRILTIKNLSKEQQASKFNISSSILSNPKVQLYYKTVDNVFAYSEAFEELLRPFKGLNSAGLTQNQMTLLDPLFRRFGWTISLLDINCRDAHFYEYVFKECKLMFIKNALPPADYYNSINNNIEVDFTYDYMGTGGRYYVGGGKYRMIQFLDDENKKYRKVIKATSERK